ncbi:hypothetical protein ABDA29_18940 [Bacillus pumilus]
MLGAILSKVPGGIHNGLDAPYKRFESSFQLGTSRSGRFECFTQ